MNQNTHEERSLHIWSTMTTLKGMDMPSFKKGIFSYAPDTKIVADFQQNEFHGHWTGAKK